MYSVLVYKQLLLTLYNNMFYIGIKKETKLINDMIILIILI